MNDINLFEKFNGREVKKLLKLLVKIKGNPLDYIELLSIPDKREETHIAIHDVESYGTFDEAE